MSFESDATRGVYNHFGPRSTTEGMKFGGRVSDEVVKLASWQFTYNDLPVGGSTNTHFFSIPVGAKLTNAWFQVDTAFAGGTSYDIGLVDSAGTEIDLDGLWDGLTLAEIDASETVLDSLAHAGINSGAILMTPLASAAQLKVVATGTFTAGQARILIEYIPVAP